MSTESTVIQTLFEMSGITAEKLNQQLGEMVDKAAQPIILFWDINDIIRATTFNRKTLEDHILNDPRIRRYERRREKGGKRIWLRQPTAKVLEEIIMTEWM
ncbi:hypothetical protein [Sporosarcina obsidiansis]|uniref:hypothetical protein n=1 Tax=Sporosarcina obsidiansis TaxID=2660748 RepID=UPI00129BC09B|nr:hypothetical protein [Sporosarcina obsidiansis]